MFKRVDTVFLPVRDLDQAIGWYTQTLGFPLRWKRDDYAALNAGETVVTLYRPDGEFQPMTGHMPFNFYHTDIDVAHRELSKAGATVGPVERFPDFAHFPFSDPDGNSLGVCWFPEEAD